MILVFSSAFILTHEHHNCTGADCPVCAQIQAVVNILNSIKAVIVLLFSFGGLFVFTCKKVLNEHDKNDSCESPFKLKVKLSI